MTLPTAAKPSSESPRETRSTVVVSTRVVSLRTPGPKRRASEAASLAGGAAGPWVASRRSASPAITSELVPDAEAQHLVLADATRVADQLVVALERGVPGGLVREPERRDTARERGVAGDARGHVRVGVVALVAHEGIELLGRPGGEGVRSEEHTSELQSPCNLVCRLLLEKNNRHHHCLERVLDRRPERRPRADGGDHELHLARAPRDELRSGRARNPRPGLPQPRRRLCRL